MLRSSAALQNLSDLAGGLEPSSSRAALVVTGSVALDSHAKAGIKQAVTAAGLAVEDEKLHPTGLDDELAAEVKTSSNAPSWTLLLSCEHDAAAQVLTAVIDDSENSSEQQGLVGKYGHCFATTSHEATLDKLFPPVIESDNADTSLTASSESVVTPEHERRVFTFINEECGEEADLDQPGELPAFPKTPEPLIAKARGPRPSSTNADLGRSVSRPASAGGSATAFRARPAPSNTPSITPRLSKTAAMRLGLDIPEKDRSSRPSTGGSDLASLAGIIRRPVTPPKSLARPEITPRQTKASAARLLKDQEAEQAVLRPASVRRQSSNTSERSAGYEGLPGFGGRRLSVQSTVTQPKITPKQTKSSALRTSVKEGALPALPSGTQRRQSYTTAERAALFGSIGPSGGAHSRRSSIASLQAPTMAPKQTKASLLRNGTGARVISPPLARPTSSAGVDGRSSTTPRPASAASNISTGSRPKSGLASAEVPLKVAQPKKPAIVPRVNKAAELRMAARNAQVA